MVFSFYIEIMAKKNGFRNSHLSYISPESVILAVILLLLGSELKQFSGLLQCRLFVPLATLLKCVPQVLLRQMLAGARDPLPVEGLIKWAKDDARALAEGFNRVVKLGGALPGCCPVFRREQQVASQRRQIGLIMGNGPPQPRSRIK